MLRLKNLLKSASKHCFKFVFKVFFSSNKFVINYATITISNSRFTSYLHSVKEKIF